MRMFCPRIEAQGGDGLFYKTTNKQPLAHDVTWKLATLFQAKNRLLPRISLLKNTCPCLLPPSQTSDEEIQHCTIWLRKSYGSLMQRCWLYLLHSFRICRKLRCQIIRFLFPKEALIPADKSLSLIVRNNCCRYWLARQMSQLRNGCLVKLAMILLIPLADSWRSGVE